ncbi:hypothetical protein PC128_g21633 [Phytophthora cactorum]|nr:hypothetical protein PC128_g21633 [Phytophthora cactorum]
MIQANKSTTPSAPHSPLLPPLLAMVRNTGTSNYSLSDIDRLLLLVEKTFPLGKDDLRRKFKGPYGTRKPTGMPDTQPHIQKAKEDMQAIHEKASVVKVDDGEDDDQRGIEPGSVSTWTLMTPSTKTATEIALVCLRMLVVLPLDAENLVLPMSLSRRSPRFPAARQTEGSSKTYSKLHWFGGLTAAARRLPVMPRPTRQPSALGHAGGTRDELEAAKTRKVEDRRVEEERRPRSSSSRGEAESEERRRTERLEMEERVRRVREKARARTQELVMSIGAVTNNT